MTFTVWTVFAQRQLLPEWLNVPFELYYTIMVGNIIMFVTTVIASFVLPRKHSLSHDLTIWTHKQESLEIRPENTAHLLKNPE
ncbi:MAG: hypothetical protein A2Y10_18570 [Planctomycetes bacterium GWF2_41_51]|nr:MAG: hypothetical protein A2Y10_18570 [Planctomycetes bacterium GWF2_41_51]HBG27148.1 hypothetical protein [Phycisphaerales bacterium]